MQMHSGKRTGEGSFNVALKEIFYKADISNRRKLVAAFPEFFGEEVPEFGVFKHNQPTKREVTINIDHLIECLDIICAGGIVIEGPSEIKRMITEALRGAIEDVSAQ